MPLSDDLRNILYLVAAVLFIVGIRGLTHPRTAVRGNMLGACGMLVAIVVTLLDKQITGWAWIGGGVAVGAVIGVILAVKIQMTAMPQLVALFNGFGGIASAIVAGATMHELLGLQAPSSMQVTIAIIASGLIGGVTFSGSVLAFAKLQELVSGSPIVHVGLKIASAALALAALAVSVLIVLNPDQPMLYWALVAISLLLGVLVVAPIGGADMPVVISLLNSYSGLAACATGFVIDNTVLIVAGSLVGASGLILTRIMCVSMNRSLTNVLFGVMAEAGAGPSADDVYAGKVKATSPDEVAMLLEDAQRVVIIPGYGMAVAQAQHAVQALRDILITRGTVVDFAVHPVAGRMPGHMNVLLAEVDIPYDSLRDLDESNAIMEQTDVAIVLGANDVVNPIARDPTSPIAGMPIIDVDKARSVIVIKRSLSPGFAGIPNPLFALDNSLMLFGDAEKAIRSLNTALKDL